MKIALVILLYFGQSTEPARIDGGSFETSEACQAASKDMNLMLAKDLKSGNMVGVTTAISFCQDGKKIAQ